MALTNNDLQAIASLLQPINNRLDNMDSRLEKMENRLDKLESEVSALKVEQKEIEENLQVVKDKVTDTYELALEAWGQSTENRTWLKEESQKQKAIS